MHFLTQPSLGFGSSLSATANGASIDCQNMSKLSFQVTQTAGSVSWSAVLQLSNDNVNWSDSTATASITAAGSSYIEKVDVAARYCRLRLVRTSGTLTGFTAVFNGKF